MTLLLNNCHSKYIKTKLKFSPAISFRALSIKLVYYLVGGIVTTWSFFTARALSI